MSLFLKSELTKNVNSELKGYFDPMELLNHYRKETMTPFRDGRFFFMAFQIHANDPGLPRTEISCRISQLGQKLKAGIDLNSSGIPFKRTGKSSISKVYVVSSSRLNSAILFIHQCMRLQRNESLFIHVIYYNFFDRVL